MENNDSFFKRTDKPPKVVRLTPVLRILNADRWEGVILSHRPRWILVHWCPKTRRTLPHTERVECPSCKELLPKKYKGYLTVCRLAAGTTGFLELTETGGEDLAKALHSPDDYRGLRLRVFRKGASSRKELCFEQLGERFDTERLPKDLDPEMSLRRLWGLDRPLPG